MHDEASVRKGLHLLVDPEGAGALAFYQVLGFRRDSWEMRRAL